MKVIEGQPPSYPHRCITMPPGIVPQPGDRFIDTGTYVEPPTSAQGDFRVYVAESRVLEMARLFGFLSPAEEAVLRDRISELEGRARELGEHIEAQDELVQAARYSLESFGGQLRKKPGPKPKVGV